jgi:hypothetical protein
MATTPVLAATFDKISSYRVAYQVFGWTDSYPTAERMRVRAEKMKM